MKSFLKTLERFVNIMDNELQQPIVQVLSGEVFTHDPTSHCHSSQEQPVQQAAPLVVTATITAHKSRSSDSNVVCPPTLRTAVAHKK